MAIKRVALAGSFDPLTLGHLDIILRGATLFGHVVVLVAENTSKRCMFSLEERFNFVTEAFNDMENVSVDTCTGLVSDYCKKNQVEALFRGIRTVSDYEYESSMSRLNLEISDNDLETVFLMASQKYSHVNSNMVKEYARFGRDVAMWVPEHVAKALVERAGSNAQE